MGNGQVYVMQDASGLVKIGRSANPVARQKILAIGNPSIKLLFSSDVISNNAEVESECHKRLSENLVTGEWFNCDAPEAMQVVSVVCDAIGKDAVEECREDAQVIERINNAVNSGISAISIARCCGIGKFRFSSVINPRSYRGMTTFNSKEIKRINEALDKIKNSF